MDGSQRIILTREQDRNRIWADRLAAAGRPFSLLPLVHYVPLALPQDADFTIFDWILFTSPQGVQAFRDLAPATGGAQFAVLGHGTAAAVAAAGWTVGLNAAGRDGVDLAAAFLATVTAPCRVLLPGPARRLTEPRASLEAAGHQVTELPLYETRAVEPAAIAAGELRPDDVILFCSPSAVRAFAAARDDKPRCVAIGQTTADACRAAGFSPVVADTPDLDAMVRAAGFADLPAPTPEPATPEMES